MAIDCSELGMVLYNLARAHAQQDSVNTIDDVLSLIQKEQPDVDREQLVGAIVEASTARASTLKRVKSRFEKIKGEAKQDKALQTAIGDLEAHLSAGTLPEGKSRPAAASEAIQELRDKRDAVKRALAQSEPAVQARLQKRLTKLLNQLETNDFAIPIPRESVPGSKEVNRLTAEIDAAERKINQKIEDAKPKSVFGHYVNFSNAVRFLKAGFDFSVVGVQTIFHTLAHPVRTYQNTIDGFRAVSSPEKAQETMKGIQDRELAPWYKVGELGITDYEGGMDQMDETYMTTLFRRLPEVVQSKFAKSGYAPALIAKAAGKVGQVGHALGRGGAVYLNKTRADLFDSFANAFADGEMTIDRAKAIGSLVNNLTGRGSLGAFEKSAPAINALLFSARNFTSQIAREFTIPAKIATGETLNLFGREHTILGGKELQRAVAKHYGRVIAGAMAVYGFAAASGADIKKDPNKSDFGDIVLPGTNIHINPFGGMRTAFVLVHGLVTGQKKTQSGKTVNVTGPKSRLGEDFDANISHFVRQKEAPLTAAMHDWLAQKTSRGDPVTAGTLLGDLFIPMTPQDMYQAVEDAGLPKGMIASALIWFGAPTQVYTPHKKPAPKVRAGHYAP